MHYLERCRCHDTGCPSLRVANDDGKTLFVGKTVQAAATWLWQQGHKEVVVVTGKSGELFLVEPSHDPTNGAGDAHLRRPAPDPSAGHDAGAALKLPLKAETRSSQDSATAASAVHRRRRRLGR